MIQEKLYRTIRLETFDNLICMIWLMIHQDFGLFLEVVVAITLTNRCTCVLVYLSVCVCAILWQKAIFAGISVWLKCSAPTLAPLSWWWWPCRCPREAPPAPPCTPPGWTSWPRTCPPLSSSEATSNPSSPSTPSSLAGHEKLFIDYLFSAFYTGCSIQSGLRNEAVVSLLWHFWGP